MVHAAAAPAVVDAGPGPVLGADAVPVAGFATGPGPGSGALDATGLGAPVIKEEAADGPDAPYRDHGKVPFDQEELTRCVDP